MRTDLTSQRLKQLEPLLDTRPFAEVGTFERNGRALHVAVTSRLRKYARKQGLWRSREMLATLKNAAYGFDPGRSRSLSGRDGIFRIDRDFAPRNAMMHKLFDRFLDIRDSEADHLAAALGVELDSLIPVRLVSHHLRLLGVLCCRECEDLLVLVDCDRSV